MAAFLTALKKRAGQAGKAIGRAEKSRVQQRFGLNKPTSSGSAGADPVADAVSADMRGKKRSTKQRD